MTATWPDGTPNFEFVDPTDPTVEAIECAACERLVPLRDAVRFPRTYSTNPEMDVDGYYLCPADAQP